MRYRELGNTGLMVSETGFGTIPVLSGNVPVLPDYYSPDVDEAVEIIKRDTRHFAKKQLTWFQRERVTVEVNREALGSEEKILDFVLSAAKLRGVI